MTKIHKLIERLLVRPTSLHYNEIERILLHMGFEKVEAKGSHKKFKHSRLTHDLILPVHKNECKDYYKRLTSKIIKEYLIDNYEGSNKTLHNNQ